ncbi:MAG: molecular chaperone HtpG, partial [Algoriella sp.]
GKLVVLYTSDADGQDQYIQIAKEKGYEVILLDSPIASHLIQKLESTKENVTFVRVDADHINNLIEKDEVKISKLSEDDKEKLKTDITTSINNKSYTIQLEDLSASDAPFIITQSEFMRRMKDMQASGGAGIMGMGNFPEMYNVVVNSNSDLASEILTKESKEEKEALINQALDLAKLSQGLLKGKELTNFINRSFKNIK